MHGSEDDHASILPIFPLPDVVLLPETFLPLHIFESRYRTMLADALSGGRMIGMQTATKGPETFPHFPGALEIGCAGEIVEHEPLEDGRSNIILKGLFRYRILKEVHGLVYRRAEVEPLPVVPLLERPSGEPGRRELRKLVRGIVSKLAENLGRPEAGEFEKEASDEGLINEMAQRLGLSTNERYQFLAMNSLKERYLWISNYAAGVQRRLDLLAPYRRGGHDPRLN